MKRVISLAVTTILLLSVFVSCVVDSTRISNPVYPAIDSVSYDVRSNYYKGIVNILGLNVMDGFKDQSLFFEPPLAFALWLMEINKRDEAARFEPMEYGENAAAVQQVSRINWEKYPYSVILVPGHGPEEKGIDEYIRNS